MPMDRVGIVPGSVGDIIIESGRQQAQRRMQRNPMQMRQRRINPDVINPVVDYRPTPMPRRGRGGREM